MHREGKLNDTGLTMRINNEIKSTEVMLVGDSAGAQRMKLTDAIELAESRGEDVVEISNKEGLPVVKICSYDKFIYDKQKKEKELRKKQRSNIQQLKEVQISDSIAKHDLEVKAKTVDRLLNEGAKVTLSIRYRGRAMKMIHGGPSKLQALADLVTVEYKVDTPIKIDGNRVTMTLKPVQK